MALESCEVHYASFLEGNFFLRKIGKQWYHGDRDFRYSSFHDTNMMDEEDNEITESISLILPSRLITYNATETEN